MIHIQEDKYLLAQREKQHHGKIGSLDRALAKKIAKAEKKKLV
jgi:hypothetical protein